MNLTDPPLPDNSITLECVRPVHRPLRLRHVRQILSSHEELHRGS